MKTWIIAIVILLFPASAMCAPFLTCDCTVPADKVTGFSLQFGVQPAIDIPAVECSPVVVDGKRIWYDLETLPNGAFSVKAMARNLWGSSAYTAPLADTKAVPTLPGLLKITQ